MSAIIMASFHKNFCRTEQNMRLCLFVPVQERFKTPTYDLSVVFSFMFSEVLRDKEIYFRFRHCKVEVQTQVIKGHNCSHILTVSRVLNQG